MKTDNKNSVAFISHPDCLLHDLGPQHPENPERLRVIEHAIHQAGLNKYLTFYEAPFVKHEQLLQIHTTKYIDSIFQIQSEKELVWLDPDTGMNAFTLTAALRAAGAVVSAVDLIMDRKVNSAFCSVRPPGHHAEKNKAMGFCIFNNIAVGVAHALNHYHLQRIAIVDFDVHHGNGTEDIFLHEPRVLFCSSFQYPLYPFEEGNTKSEHIMNIPLDPGTNGETYRTIVTDLWLDKIKNFKPEIIFISAGFDAYKNDEMSDLLLDINDYAWITRELKLIANKYCQGRIISVLEGGYDLKGLGDCVVAHVKEL